MKDDQILIDKIKYKSLLDKIDQGFCIIKMIFDEAGQPIDYIFIETNPSFEEQTGLKDVVGSKMRDLQPSHEDHWFRIYGNVAKTGKSEHFENEAAYLKGGLWYDVYAFAVENPEKDLVAIFFKDITERKRNEEIILQNQERFSSILNNSQDIIYCLNLQTGFYEYFSPSAKEILGYTVSELCSMDISTALSMIHPDHISEVKKAHKLSEETGKAKVEYLQRGKDGNYLWISNHMSVTKDKDGKVLFRYGNIRDITELKRSEEALKNANIELKLSQNKLNIALDNGNIGIWEWNLKTNEMIWDERMERMFRIDPGSFGSTFKAFENQVNEEDLQHVTTALNYALEHDTPFETMYRIRSTPTKYITSKAIINKNCEGNPTSFTGTCFDVTELRESAEQVILNLNLELLRSNKELENFAYVASHDLQEPLRMVTSFTQLLQIQYKDKLNDDANTYINYAVEGSKRMYDLLNGLLAYSKVNTKGRDFTPVDMNKVIVIVLSNLRLKIDETKAFIDFTDLPCIIADENQMVQLIQNLIENSIKFSRGIPNINILSSSRDGHFVFSIKDKGIGIEPQYFERIFKIFQRLHLRDDYAGMGVGLAICNRIVERHKGKIWVESKPEEGYTFNF